MTQKEVIVSKLNALFCHPVIACVITGMVGCDKEVGSERNLIAAVIKKF